MPPIRRHFFLLFPLRLPPPLFANPFPAQTAEKIFTNGMNRNSSAAGAFRLVLLFWALAFAPAVLAAPPPEIVNILTLPGYWEAATPAQVRALIAGHSLAGIRTEKNIPTIARP
ncbi:MAG: hypothetical protein LBS49_01940 [Candidatus Accumulibacter sp.]|jgi:hypothetical protein|nr:hypothetical protein [Accumulibacter sp.]